MSISLVQSTAATTSGTNTVTKAFASNVTSGNLLVVDVDWGGAGVTGDYTFSDTIGNTYTKNSNGPVTNSNQSHMAWTVTGSSAANSVTVTVANNGNHTIRIAIYEYNSTTGWTSPPLDSGTEHTSTGGGTTGNPGSITPAASGELVHANIQWTTAVSAVSCTAPYTERPAGGTNGWVSDGRADSGDNQNCASGSQTCTFNWTTSASWGAIIAAFKPAAGGGGGGTGFEDDSFNAGMGSVLVQPVDPIVSVW